MNDENPLETLSQSHYSHWRLKTVVDMINGLSIADDLTRTREQRSGLGHLFATMSGRSSKEQQLVDGNIISSLRLAQQVILSLQQNQTEIDLGLATVGIGMNKIFALQEKLRIDVASLHELQREQQLANLQFHEQVHQRIGALELYRDARHEIDMTVHSLKQGTMRFWPALARAYWAADRLWWGKLGVYIRHGRRDPRSTELMEFARGQLVEALTMQATSSALLRPAAEWLSELDTMEPKERHALGLLSGVGSGNAPLIHVIHDTLEQHSPDLSGALVPRMLSPQTIVNRMMIESRHVMRDPNELES